MKTESALQDDSWREDFRCYGSQWGYEPGTPVCNLIDFVRNEFCVKYGVDYHLRALADGSYQVCAGRNSDGTEARFGEADLLEHAQRFGVRILPSDDVVTTTL